MTAIPTVDDSPSIRQMIRVALGLAGHTIIEASDGTEHRALAPSAARHAGMVLQDLASTAAPG
jgi:two-component system chemotaxis response regulator CheY